MKITEVLKSVNPSILKSASQFKNKIREFEEESKGHFIAYVDDGKNSWDVSIVIDSKNLNIKKCSCDCLKKLKYCEHIIAVMHIISNGSKVKESILVKKLKKKKLTEGEQLIEKLNQTEIYDWLISELNQNTELLLKFKNHFSDAKNYTKDSIQENFKNAKKAILGRRKRAATVEIAKIIKLLEGFHFKVIEEIQHILASRNSIEIIIEINEVCEALNFLSTKHTTRVKTYVRKLNDKIIAHISLLENDAINDMMAFKEMQKVGSDLLIAILKNNYERISKNLRIELVKQLILSRDHSEKFMISILELVTDDSSYAELITSFPGIGYFNKYNIQLLDLLIKHQDYQLALDLSEQLVEINYHEYKLPYINKIIEIFLLTGNEKQAKELIISAFKSFPNADFLHKIIEMKLNANDLHSVLSVASSIALRPNTKSYKSNLSTKFLLWSYIKSYDKILQKMKDADAIDEAIKYESELLKYDKIRYLSKFFDYIDNRSWYFESYDYQNYLKDLTTQKYSSEEISLSLNGRSVLNYKFLDFNDFDEKES